MAKNNKYQEFSDFIKGMTTIVEDTNEDSERLSRTEKLLSELISTRSWLPLEKIQPDNDRQYARHSLYHDPEDRFEVLVLVWPPGQETPLHDHDGTWGVEGVIAGRIKVTNYLQLKDNDDGTVKLGRAGVMRINEQSTGELLPPADCHTLEAEGNEVAITVHVYGKKLRKFRVFESLGEDDNYSTKEVATGYTTESALLASTSISEK